MTKKNPLVDICETRIRFSEVDSMGILWHGNYIKLFEDGRESWGLNFGLHYIDVYKNNVVTPIVHTSIDHKKVLKYGDTAIIETEYVDTVAAKIKYKYRISRKLDGQIVAVGETIQVFTEINGDLILSPPEFFLEWKRKHGLID
jgi:acyl-CoA thioester hydrolase